MINLIYRPANKFRGLFLGAEWEKASRNNKDGSSSDTNRTSFLMYYDF